MKIFPTVNDLQRAHGVTWGELTPQLLELLWQARAAAGGCYGWEDVPRVFAPF